MVTKGKSISYSATLPKKMYTYFSSYGDTGAPSFDKFARSIGATLSLLESFRKHKIFDRAWRECNEIRRDYLIDCALTKRHDPSFSKFLLQTEYGMDSDTKEDDSPIAVTLEVLTK